MKPRNLEEVKREVEKIRDESGEIDKKIKPLVTGLRRWGVNTEFSCQGHERSKNEALSYPSVIISPKDYRKAKKLISTFGRNSWLLKKEIWFNESKGATEITLKLLPRNKKNRTLIKMQRDAIKFGEFLQELPDDWFEGLK